MIIWNELTTEQQKQTLARPAIADSETLSAQVAEIIEQVKLNGDQALYQLTEKFDGIKLTTLAVTPAQVDKAKSALSEKRLRAINTAYGQIQRFHAAQQASDIEVETTPGVLCTLKTQAIESVGLYIPAGSAPLPSTVLMLGVPSQLAGCERVVLVCPPDKKGQLANEILVAASLCNITEIYTVGGAQAIAALAYGSESIPAVNKVFGPGNRYVTEAKKQLSQQVAGFAIDMPAGPSEVLVIGDQQSDASFIAADLLSQAEHGADSQVILLSDNETLITDVQLQLTQQLQKLSRQTIAEQALKQSRLILVKDIAQAVEVSNLYAPEHLIIQTEQPRNLLPQLRNAGSIFVGKFTPESAGDYASGTNHVLPTYGFSKVVSSLSLADFSRRYTVQEITREGLSSLAECIIELTDAEGLDGHQRAVTIRLENTSPVKQDEQSEKNATIASSLARPELINMQPYQSARRLQAGNGDFQSKIWLNANEASGKGEYQLNSECINRYPDFQPDALISAYSDYSKVDKNNILATRGADEGIELLIRTFCRAYQDSILICPPTYGMYAISAKNHGAAVIEVPLKSSVLDLDRLAEQVGHTKIVFLCSPGNPTGNLLSAEQIKAVLALFKDTAIVVVDEAYIEFSPENTAASWLNEYDNLVVLRTLSKAFALAGVRCGFTLASAEIITLLSKVIAPYPISAPVADIASQALSEQGLTIMSARVNEVTRSRQQLITWLSEQVWCEQVYASDANFVLFRCTDKALIFNTLAEKSILVRDQSKQQQLDNCLRISIGSEAELAQLKSVLTTNLLPTNSLSTNSLPTDKASK